MNTLPHIPEKLSLLQLRGCDWLGLPPKARSSIVTLALQYWRCRGFPHYRLTPKQVRQEMSNLLRKNAKAVFDGGELRASNAGLRLANSFQPHMWNATVSRYLSPMMVFRDDRLLRKAIERSFTIWPNRFGANASCIRRILKTFPGAASVSNYRPLIAKAIVSRYCPAGGTVIDFAAGYGGRLLGAIAANRHYIGIEPNRAQVRGFIKMSEAISNQGFELPHLKFLHGTAEMELCTLRQDSAELVFSSPPFFNWEQYSHSCNQSFRRYPRYDNWLTGFLIPVIGLSYRILKNNGHLVLNVTNGHRQPSPTDVSKIARESRFRLVRIHKMVFPKVPYLHPRGTGPVKRELVMVFRKQAQGH